jgi:hypothetical protein
MDMFLAFVAVSFVLLTVTGHNNFGIGFNLMFTGVTIYSCLENLLIVAVTRCPKSISPYTVDIKVKGAENERS